MWRRGLAVALAIAAAACSASERGSFTMEQVPGIVLQADEAPEGTRKVAGVGGEQGLDTFARNATERAALVRDGFVSGYVSYFAPDAYFDPEESVGADAISFQVIAGVFETPGGASSSLRRFLGNLRTRQLAGAVDAPAPELGDESYGLSGSSPADGSALIVYLWRRSNLILVISGSGPVDPSAMRSAAQAMAERAR
jgi:hypothetical protein